jgi:hypothetical protein
MAKTKKPSDDLSPKKHSGKALAGKSPAGKEMDLNESLLAAFAPVVEVNEPRPLTSRYPISQAEFDALKQAAKGKETVSKGAATLIKDSGKKRELATEAFAAAAPAAALALAEEPAAAPTPVVNFRGLSATGWIPPDCTLATGPQHLLASVNSSVAVFAKIGGALLQQRTLTQWFSNVVQGVTIFDPKALYDQHAGRWVLLAVAFSNNPNKSWFLLSVSATSNPLGQWRNYALDAGKDGNTPTGNWADFPGLGVDNKAFYISANMFKFGGGFQYAKIRIIAKAGPYAGGTAPYFDFVKMKNANNTLAFSIQPCHTFGAPQVENLVNSYFPQGNRLSVWAISNPTTAPVLTLKTVPTATYALPPNADQKGGATPLNTGDVRILHAVSRGGSVWTALTTQHNWGSGTNKAAIHWFQINSTSATLVQQGVYGAAGLHYFYPAAMPDTNGNMIMVFSRSGTNEFASIFYTGRKSTDPLGALQASALLKAGAANYVRLDGSGRNRWGDYNGIAGDPSDPRIVTFYSMYAVGVNQWDTWIGSARF